MSTRHPAGRALTLLLVASAALLATHCREAATPPPAERSAATQPVGSVKDIMLALTIPASEAVFKAAAEPPATDAQWDAVGVQAMVLAESANLLMLPGRAVDEGAWLAASRAQLTTATKAAAAAKARNADELSAASDAIYESCDTCHNQYMKK